MRLRLTLLVVGSIKEIYIEKAVDQWVKKLSGFAEVKVVEVSDCPDSHHDPVSKEGRLLLAQFPANANIICTAIEGKRGQSVRKILDPERENIFVIGGSNGLSEDVKKRAKHCISFSQMTFPHQLMRVVLLEWLTLELAGGMNG